MKNQTQKLLNRFEARIDRLNIMGIKLEDAIDEMEMDGLENTLAYYKLELMEESIDFEINELNDLCDLMWDELDEEEREEQAIKNYLYDTDPITYFFD